MSVPEFPQLTDKKLTEILNPPVQREKPLRVVVDTDFNNEIDDHFALTWLLLQSLQPSTQLNPIDLQAVLVAPFSFKTRLDDLIKAYDIYLKPAGDRTEDEEAYLSGYKARIKSILALGITPYQLQEDPHLNGKDIKGGVEESYQSILKLFELMALPDQGKVFKGATQFMPSAYQPVESEAAKHLVELALRACPDDPLYVVAMACPTNIASALLMEPAILPNIVVIWDAGYPTNVHHLPNNSLNLDEDLYASQLLFSSGVPLVYIPGFYIAEQLNMSLPDVENCFKTSGRVGYSLYDRYIHNPLFSFYGIDPTHLFGRNWVIWDIAIVAWLLSPNSTPSNLVKAPFLTDEKYWQENPGGHLIREAYQISVNDIFPQFARQLMIWSSGQTST